MSQRDETRDAAQSDHYVAHVEGVVYDGRGDPGAPFLKDDGGIEYWISDLLPSPGMRVYVTVEAVRDGEKPAAEGVPNYGIADDYPLLWEQAQRHDFAERLGGSTDALLAEIDAALRECWDARRAYIEDGGPL